MTWHKRAMCAWDTETTSAEPEEARIVTATFVRVVGNQVEAREWLLDPGVEIPAGAAAIHGVTTEIARARGTDPAEGVAEIADEICEAWGRSEPIIVMNAPYDFTVLDREMRRLHGHGIDITGVVIDPMCIDKELDRYRRGKRTLADLCQTYGVKIEGAHSSIGDALAAARVAWRLAQKYPEYLSRIEDLNEMQAKWRADWAAQFVDYLRREGKPFDDVRSEWPMIPFGVA